MSAAETLEAAAKLLDIVFRWPFAAIVIVWTLSSKFRDPLGRLIDRLKTFKGWGADLEVVPLQQGAIPSPTTIEPPPQLVEAPAESKVEVSPNAPVPKPAEASPITFEPVDTTLVRNEAWVKAAGNQAGMLPPSPSAFAAIQHSPITAFVDIQHALRMWRFERIWSAVYGSQLRMLAELTNRLSRSATTLELSKFYSEHVTAATSAGKPASSYEAYMGWIVNMGLIRYEGPSQHVFASEVLPEFMEYVLRHYPTVWDKREG